MSIEVTQHSYWTHVNIWTVNDTLCRVNVFLTKV